MHQPGTTYNRLPSSALSRIETSQEAHQEDNPREEESAKMVTQQEAEDGNIDTESKSDSYIDSLGLAVEESFSSSLKRRKFKRMMNQQLTPTKIP